MTIEPNTLNKTLSENEETQEDISKIDFIKISLASPQKILSWSHGEVTKPETINYRTLKPERDGLFCERIFGPAKDWECHCGKYKKVRHKGIICERCGVEVTDSKVRRYRMGHIKLAAPVVHIWYLKGIPNHLSLLLDISSKTLEDVVYYNKYIVIDPGNMIDEKGDPLSKGQELSEEEYEILMAKASEEGLHFEAGMGAEAIKKLLNQLKLEELVKQLREELNQAEDAKNKDKVKQLTSQKRTKLIKRLRLMEHLIESKINPVWMIIEILPVIPPDLRPMVQLDGGRFATSDLNDLYRRVINRNKRLQKLIEMEAPDIIIRNEKRMLQEAVDALIDNGRRGKKILGSNNRALKSLSDIIEGKQGRFRQNLLGKRVDYSGRSVIVVGPKLKLHQCGLPKEMALELFKPFVMHQLVAKNIVQNIKSAKKKIERQESIVWDVLEEVIKGHPVLLNRAPTLHRLGIQAFEPILVEGRAIQLHPLVCAAFNADFDGDQMAVHVPLSIEAQTEARVLMLANNNILLPATGKPIITPTHDMVLGCYYLTVDNPKSGYFIISDQNLKELENIIDKNIIKELIKIKDKLLNKEQLLKILNNLNIDDKNKNIIFKYTPFLKGEGSIFLSTTDALLAYEIKNLDIHAKIKVKLPVSKLEDDEIVYLSLKDNGQTLKDIDKDKLPKEVYIETTVGRIIFNEVLPNDFKFYNKVANKKALGDIVAKCYERYGNILTAETANAIKDLGFKYATISGVSISLKDLVVPPEKKEIIERAKNAEKEKIKQYQRGEITEIERYSKVINIWSEATEELTNLIIESANIDKLNSVYMMAFSGARGNISQVRQLIGMRGLMADPAGKIIELPIESNFKEGLTVTEYIISSYGARKGLVDTALRTADSGYLTRRLADVAQEVIIKEYDCGTDKGLIFTDIQDVDKVIIPLKDRIIGRVSAQDVINPDTNEIILKRNEEITPQKAEEIIKAGIKEIKLRSPVTCNNRYGVCSKCYGWNLAYNKMIEIGEAIGIIAAQSIGEPGTQLTMRTFHTGGVFSKLETRNTIKAGHRGKVKYDKKLPIKIMETHNNEQGMVTQKECKIFIITADGEKHAVTIPPDYEIKVKEGENVSSATIVAESIYESVTQSKKSLEKVYKEIIANISGQVKFSGFEADIKRDRQGTIKIANRKGVIWINNGEVYNFPSNSEIIVKDNQKIKEGDCLARIATVSEFGGKIRYTDEDKAISIIAAEISCNECEIVKEENEENHLHFKNDKFPLTDFQLFVTPGIRIEDKTIIAETFYDKYKVPANGEIRYIKVETTEKHTITDKSVIGFIPCEQYSVPKTQAVLVDESMYVQAGTEILDGITVEQDGFVSLEYLELSQQVLFYPGAKVYKFPSEHGFIQVEDGYIVKKKQVIGTITDPETKEEKEILSDIEGIVKILFSGEIGKEIITVIVRPITIYKVEPIKKFYTCKTTNNDIDIVPVTRLVCRDGDFIRQGSSFIKINLAFRLTGSLTNLGGYVDFEDIGENKKNLKISVIEHPVIRREGKLSSGLSKYDLNINTIFLVKDGDIIDPKTTIAYTEYISPIEGTVSLPKSSSEEFRKVLIFGPDNQIVYDIPKNSKAIVQEGQEIRELDKLTEGEEIFAKEEGIVEKVTKDKIIIRKARPYLVNHGTQLLIDDGDFVQKGENIAILVYEQYKTGDIVQGLPRVEELLECRKPKDAAIFSEHNGIVNLKTKDDILTLTIVDENGEEHSYPVPKTNQIIVNDGQEVKRGDMLTDGPINPQDIVRTQGLEAVQRYLIEEIQRVYKSQGVDISDKHLEVIIKQMTKKLKVEEPGDTTYLPGELINTWELEEVNKKIEEKNKSLPTEQQLKPCIAVPVVLGITKASLNTDSFISAASFQETTKVLTEAAIEGKKDYLRGLKENVIIGRLIPAGTGAGLYLNK